MCCDYVLGSNPAAELFPNFFLFFNTFLLLIHERHVDLYTGMPPAPRGKNTVYTPDISKDTRDRHPHPKTMPCILLLQAVMCTEKHFQCH